MATIETQKSISRQKKIRRQEKCQSMFALFAPTAVAALCYADQMSIQLSIPQLPWKEMLREEQEQNKHKVFPKYLVLATLGARTDGAPAPSSTGAPCIPRNRRDPLQNQTDPALQKVRSTAHRDQQKTSSDKIKLNDSVLFWLKDTAGIFKRTVSSNWQVSPNIDCKRRLENHQN